MSTMQENATRNSTLLNLKTVQSISCRQCKQATCHLGTSGHKSLHNLNMWGWMWLNPWLLHSIGWDVLSQMEFSFVLKLLSNTVKDQPYSIASLFSTSFFSCHLPASLCQLLSTPLQNYCADHHWSTEDIVCCIPFSRRIVYCDIPILCSLSLASVLQCWCAVQDTFKIGPFFLLTSILLYNRIVIQWLVLSMAQSWILGKTSNRQTTKVIPLLSEDIMEYPREGQTVECPWVKSRKNATL